MINFDSDVCTNFQTASSREWLETNGNELVYEHNGYLHLLDPVAGKSTKLEINVIGDFPWAGMNQSLMKEVWISTRFG